MTSPHRAEKRRYLSATGETKAVVQGHEDAVYDANHAPFELVSHDEVEDVLEVLTNASGR